MVFGGRWSLAIRQTGPRRRCIATIDIDAIIRYEDGLTSRVPAPAMSSATVRNLDPAIKERLRVRAAQNGHSMEAEARRILQATLKL